MPPTIALGELRGGESRVAVVGTTAFGPGGPVVGPVSGEECAGFRVRLTRSPSRRADEDGGGDVLFDVASPSPTAMVDRSGAVLIDPGLLAEPPTLHDPVATEQVRRLLHGGSAADWPSLVPRGLLEDKRPTNRCSSRKSDCPRVARSAPWRAWVAARSRWGLLDPHHRRRGGGPAPDP